jgi:limonene-1,2-epoxide hydrolase
MRRCEHHRMSEITPEEVVRRFWTEFGPTYEDAVASAKRWLHQDLELVAFNAAIERLETMLEDLQRARDALGIHGYRVVLPNVAANGNIVFAERHEELLSADGEVVTTFDVIGVFTVEDGRIRRFRDYFFDSRQMSAGWEEPSS